jgi:hypothetical protein
MRKIFNRSHSSKKFVRFAVIATLSIQIALMLASYNLVSREYNAQGKLFDTYLTWHVDTDLQFMSGILGIEPNQRFGLNIVTSSNPAVPVSELNRLNPLTSDLVSEAYLSSSGIFEIASNWVYRSVFDELVSPTAFLIILRLLFMTLSYAGFYYFLMLVADCFRGRYFPLLVLFCLYNPWFFLDASSLSWSPAIRYAPIFFISYQLHRMHNKLDMPIHNGLLTVLLLVASTFNGFEMTGLVAGLVLIWSFLNRQQRSLTHLMASVATVFISIVGAFISWLVVLIVQFEGNASTAFSLIRYTLFKHSTFNSSNPLPPGALASSDPEVSALSALFRIAVRTSLLIPYDLMLILRGDSKITHALLFFFVTLTSLATAILVVTYILGTRPSLLTAFLLVLMVWVFSIKSYAYHHVHILGSALLLFAFMLTLTSRLERDRNAHNSFKFLQ